MNVVVNESNKDLENEQSSVLELIIKNVKEQEIKQEVKKEQKNLKKT